MADTTLSSTRVSNIANTITDFTVQTQVLDVAGNQKETIWQNPKHSQQLGYYKEIPELKSAIDAKAKWTIGRGFTANDRDTVTLENIRGYREDTFNIILKNMIIAKQITGDSYAEIIRDRETGRLLNLKVLNSGAMRIVYNRQGTIEKYQYPKFKVEGKEQEFDEFEPQEILHFVNNRIENEIHGTSIIDSVESIILKRNEALDDYQKVLHRNVYPVKIWYLDTDDPTEIQKFIAKIELTTKDKENIFVPKGQVEVDVSSIAPNSTLNPMPFITLLSNFFFQAVGIPQIVLGGSQEFTEATAKISYLAFQQSVEDEQREIEAQIWSQLAIRINLIFPASLENELLSDKAKDKTSGATQPNDTTVGVVK